MKSKTEKNEEIANKHFDQAYECWEKSQYAEALEECNKVVELTPTWSNGHNLRGVVLEELGRPDEAISAYREAVRLDPHNKDAKKSLALASGEKPKNASYELLLIIGLAVIGIALVGWFVWPTPYKYQNIAMGFLGEQTIRTSRFTQESYICGEGQWQRIEIEGDIVKLSGITLTIGENSCARTPVVVIVTLALLGAAELSLVILFIVRGRRKSQDPIALSHTPG